MGRLDSEGIMCALHQSPLLCFRSTSEGHHVKNRVEGCMIKFARLDEHTIDE